MQSRPARFDLTISAVEQEQSLTLTWIYKADLFKASTIARMADQFQNLLQGIVADPGRRMTELPLSPPRVLEMLDEEAQTD